MKLSAFEKLIRKVIREEVNFAIKKELKLLKEELSYQSPNYKPINETPSSELDRFRSQLKAQMPVPNFSTGNDTLNSLLSETAMAPSPEETIAANDPVNQFLNKDYSQIMSAIDSKKNYRP